jgi:hypothetical protein
MTIRTRRPPARIWIDLLRNANSALAGTDANDVILFGSQAMSVYTQRALASKDLDLIVPGITLTALDIVCDALPHQGGAKPIYGFEVYDYLGRRYPVGKIYLKYTSGSPMVIEFFQTFLGYPPTMLTPFLTFKDKWKMRIQVMVPEAIIGTRLAFRPPERITPFNAERLGRFIRNVENEVDWKKVNTFIDTFNLRAVVNDNLAELRTKRIQIPETSKILDQL